MEFVSNPMRNIEIKTTANGGYLVHVGCTYFAYTEVDKLLTDLGEYMREPAKVEKEFSRHHKYEEDRPVGGPSVSSSSEPRSLGEMLPETEGQAEATDPAEDIPESGY